MQFILLAWIIQIEIDPVHLAFYTDGEKSQLNPSGYRLLSLFALTVGRVERSTILDDG